MALLSQQVLPYSKWDELKGARDVRHHNYADKAKRKKDLKNTDELAVDPHLLFPDDNKPERILYIDTRAPQIAASNAYTSVVETKPSLNALGTSNEVLSSGLREQYGLPHQDFTVLYLMADNKNFKGYNPVTGEGQQREDREASYLTVVLTAGAHKRLAVALLKRMADPAKGSAMFGVDGEKYHQDFIDNGERSGQKAIVDNIIRHAGFTQSDKPLLDEVVETAAAHGSNEFGLYIKLKARVLSPAETSHISQLSGRPVTQRMR